MAAAVVMFEVIGVVISTVPAAVLKVVVVLEPVVPAIPVNDVVSPDTSVPFGMVINEDIVAVMAWTVLVCDVVPAAVIALELVSVVSSPVPAVVLTVPTVFGLAVPGLPASVLVPLDTVVPLVFVTDEDVVTWTVFILDVVLAAVVVLEGVAVVTSAVAPVVLTVPVVIELIVPVLPVNVAIAPVTVVPLVIVADEEVVDVVTWLFSVVTVVAAVVLVLEPVDVAISPVPVFEMMVTVVLELVASAPPVDVAV
jgi:hypothetical protein